MHQRLAEVWREATPIEGTLAAVYLASRGLVDLPPRLDEAIRFHPRCPYGSTRRPAMVARFVDVHTNHLRGLHRTALRADGVKVGRLYWGEKAGAAIKITPDDVVEVGLAIGEGIETVLAGMALGFRPAWCCGDAGNLATFPVFAGIESIVLLVDHDEPDRNGRRRGQESAERCAVRWKAAGREVIRVVPRQSGDIADILKIERAT